MWERCKSFSDGIGKNGSDQKKGCFPIYVGPPGPEKERFVIKTDQVNHPLFKILLEEAESEYGYAGNNGPLMLSCQVDHFLDVLIEIDCEEEEKGCNSSFHFHAPPKVIALMAA
ncbi:SAUR-like auxin-responsive protein family [Perilla frutescens var. hirtella]|uniref:SAUR-like auxin-responsive protein family n=1 Tax=Perilla frutescens var. hirtella TaxID=608512 RepID=A0AAD4NWX0_PERFH|nr:SAUR-like auxin-responsive protein family [Perilla frutescens var. hirtella]